MNIVFLDYDGVVNTLIYSEKDNDFNFNFPKDNKVNNYQAVKWLEKLCKEYKAKIVVTSSWREYDNYKECLYNGGLSKDIEIIGKIKDYKYIRGSAIREYLDEHTEIEQYVILDDENVDKENNYDINTHFVRTETNRGFDYYEYQKAKFAFSGAKFLLNKEEK